MNIAIVDDVQVDRERLAKMIRQPFLSVGYPTVYIDQFCSGEDLLLQLETTQYDIIFLDIFMPGINGIATAAKIRETDINVKLVFITVSNEFASESYAVRADDYLLKPYHEEDLLQMVSHLSRSSLESKRMIAFSDKQSYPPFFHFIYFVFRALCVYSSDNRRSY